MPEYESFKMKTKLLLLTLLFIYTAIAQADQPMMIGLTAQKSILSGPSSDAAPLEIKLASPVTADKLIGITIAEALSENAGPELIVLRSDHHIELYPLPTAGQTMLKRLGYCPLSNPAKRQEIAITACNGQLILLDQADEQGLQYADTYPLKDLVLAQMLTRSGYFNLKYPKSPHLMLNRIDATEKATWASANNAVLLTTAEDQYFELFTLEQNKTQRLGQGFKRSGNITPVAARWCDQNLTALYTDGTLVTFDQTLPAPGITQSIQTQFKSCVDFVFLPQAASTMEKE